MGWFNQYPYEDNEELNLDYLLAKVAALKDMIDETNAQIDAFNSLLVNKADKSTTLYGYGITDAYTKTQVDNLLVLKADKSNTFTKGEVVNRLNQKANISDLAAVATSGSYTDLINKPTIPAAQVNSDWNANSGVAKILNKPDLTTHVYTQNDSPIIFTPQNVISGHSLRLHTYGHIGFMNLVLTITSPTTNETWVGTLSSQLNESYTVGSVATNSNTSNLGSYILASNGRLYIKLTSTAYTSLVMTIPILL